MDFESKEKDISWDEAEQKLKKAFDFSAFLGTEELDDKVTDVMDGRDLLEPDAFDRFAPDYVPRRGFDPDRGRHEAPGQEPESMEFVEEAPAEPAMDPTDPRYAAPERPRVLVAGQQRPTVYITPEGDFDGPDNYAGSSDPPAGNGGEGKKWLVAVVIALGVVAVVLGAVLALFGGGSSTDEPDRESGILLVTPAPTDEREDEPGETEEQATPAPTDEAKETPKPTEPPAEMYTILVTAGNGGGIHPSGTVEVEEGESVTFTLYPDEGWDVSQLIIDGESVAPAGSYTFEKVKDDHTIYAVFVKLATPVPTEPPATPSPTPEPTPEPTPVPTEPPASVPEEPVTEDTAVVENTAE